MARRKNELLTEVELEFMQTLWSLGQATVREVHEALSQDPPRAYTSVATVLKVLEGKGYVCSEKEDRTLTYRPVFARSAYEQKFLRDTSNVMFGGAPSALVARLIEDENLSEDMIAEIKMIIEERMGRDTP